MYISMYIPLYVYCQFRIQIPSQNHVFCSLYEGFYGPWYFYLGTFEVQVVASVWDIGLVVWSSGLGLQHLMLMVRGSRVVFWFFGL